MKQQSIEELERELNALSPKQAKETLVEAQASDTTEQANVNDIPLEEYLDFERYPITDDERKKLELALADYGRRRHAFSNDSDLDDIHDFVISLRTTQRMLFWLRQ